jgi:hypothetical protein
MVIWLSMEKVQFNAGEEIVPVPGIYIEPA